MSHPLLRGREESDLLAEEVGKPSELGSVSRGIIIKLVDRDSMKFHVGRYRKLLCFISFGDTED